MSEYKHPMTMREVMEAEETAAPSPAAPEPVAYLMSDGFYVEFNTVDKFSCGRTGGTPLYSLPPDAAAVVAALESKIQSLCTIHGIDAEKAKYKRILDETIEQYRETADEYVAEIAKLTQERNEAQSSRQREHDLRVKLAGDLESYKSENTNLCHKVDLLTGQLAADQKDAERYRHARNCNSGSIIIVKIVGIGYDDQIVITEEDADKEIDSAIEAETKGGV